MSESEKPDTAKSAYARELVAVSGKRWKKLLNVQAPYRWNLRRFARGRVLDVGCGIGRNIAGLQDCVGVDHNEDSIKVARQAGHVAWTTSEWPASADARLESFDTLLIAHVLEHISLDEGTELIRDYVRYLKPRARLVFICPQEAGFRSDAVTHIRFVTGDDLADHARAVGFSPTTNISFPLPRLAGRAFRYNEFVMVADR